MFILSFFSTVAQLVSAPGYCLQWRAEGIGSNSASALGCNLFAKAHLPNQPAGRGVTSLSSRFCFELSQQSLYLLVGIGSSLLFSKLFYQFFEFPRRAQPNHYSQPPGFSISRFFPYRYIWAPLRKYLIVCQIAIYYKSYLLSNLRSRYILLIYTPRTEKLEYIIN